MGRFADQDPEELKRKEEEKKLKEQRDQEMADAMKIGDRYWVLTFHYLTVAYSYTLSEAFVSGMFSLLLCEFQHWHLAVQ